MNCLIDLHIHLDGSISVKSARELAKLSGIKLDMTDDEIRRSMKCPEGANLSEYLKCFDMPLSLLKTKESLSLAVYNLMNELHSDGIIYAEIRFAPCLHDMPQEEAVRSAIEGLKKSGFPGGIILCMMRHMDYDTNLETVELAKKYLGKGVCGIDLAGDESRYDTSKFEELYNKINEYSIPSTIHAGEAMGYESVDSAIKFKVSRIGHGVRGIESLNTIKALVDNNITLELCPKSNLDTHVFNSLEEYPFKKLMDNGVRITLNTDDMSVSDVTLKSQYELIKDEFKLDYNTMKQLLINSASSAFCSQELREELVKKIEKEFTL